MTTQSTRLRALLLVLCSTALTGCASSSPNWDSTFGDVVRATRAQQTLDSTAPKRNAGKTVVGDGASAVESQDQLVNSFKAPPPTTIINLGFGK